MRWVALLVVATAACGPRMKRKTVDARTFQSTTRCWQGPIEAQFKGHGARWGESIQIRACSPAGVNAQATVEVDGVWANSGPIGAGDSDNARCVVAGSGAVTATDSAGPAEHSAESGSAARPAGGAATVSQRDQFFISRSTDDVCFATMTTELVLSRVKPGADIRVRIWAKVPNDIEGGIFQIRHQVLKPNVSDAEWKKHVARRRAKRDKKRKRSITRAQLDALAAAEADEEPGPSSPTTPPPQPKVEDPPSAPYAGAEWMPGYWKWASAWVWIRGRWRPPTTPPAARDEARPAPPSAELWVWSPGYWAWTNRSFTWVAGTWLRSSH